MTGLMRVPWRSIGSSALATMNAFVGGEVVAQVLLVGQVLVLQATRWSGHREQRWSRLLSPPFERQFSN